MNTFKKLTLGLLLVATPLFGFAQGEAKQKPSWSQFETNKFWDNWFISAGAGVQVYAGCADDQGDLAKRMALGFDVAVGKWFVPTIGVRALANGVSMAGFTASKHNPYAVGNANDKGYYKQEWKQYHLEGDVLLNLSNWVGGYRSDRFYEMIPFVGFGFMHAYDPQVHNSFTFNAGLINKFRLTKALDLNIEMRGAIFPASYMPEPAGVRANGIATIMAGLTYKFNKRDFNRASQVSEEELNSALSKLNRLQDDLSNSRAENDKLRRELQDERSKPAPEPEKIIIQELAPVHIQFTIGSADLNEHALATLKAVAETIKVDGSKVYIVNGYADSVTGTETRNSQLSQDRADAVKAELVKHGASADQLEAVGHGGVSMFDKVAANRVVIVLKK